MAKITLYDTADHILGSFDNSLIKFVECCPAQLELNNNRRIIVTQRGPFKGTASASSLGITSNALKRWVNLSPCMNRSGLISRYQGKLFVQEQGEGICICNPFAFRLNQVRIPVPFGLLVWSTGIAPNPLIESITDYAKDEKGK
jgi:hypothetical protein